MAHWVERKVGERGLGHLWDNKERTGGCRTLTDIIGFIREPLDCRPRVLPYVGVGRVEKKLPKLFSRTGQFQEVIRGKVTKNLGP